MWEISNLLLVDHSGDTKQTEYTLESKYKELNPEQKTIKKIGSKVIEAFNKLKNLPAKINKAINCHSASSSQSHIFLFINNYQSNILAALNGPVALAYDYFYLFQQHKPYMHRDFLFSTPSQLR